MVSLQYHSASGTLYNNGQSTGIYVTIPADRETYVAIDSNYTPYLWIYVRNRNYNASSNNLLLESFITPVEPPGVWKIVPLTMTYGPTPSSTTLAGTSFPIFE